MSKKTRKLVGEGESHWPQIRWKQSFSTRQLLDYEVKAENMPQLEELVEQLVRTKHNLGSPEWINALDGRIRELIRGPDASDIIAQHATVPLDFCHNVSFKALLGNPQSIEKKLQPNACLDERNFKDGKVHCRQQKGALTALDLYVFLRKPVGFPTS
jgi:hypothetical protein